MRAGISLIAVAFVLLFGAQSHAATFPNLPGMGTAAKATHGQQPQTSSSLSSAPSTSSNAPSSSVSSAAKSSAKPADFAPILKMPGAASLPIIKNLTNTSERAKTAMPDVLYVLAAIGTATSLGMLWAVRRRFDRS